LLFLLLRVWGENAASLGIYSSWREMYLERPRLNFDGVYISKASYARAGEYSLDSFYSPWHLVEYYRYLRFFSNGTVLFLTSPDEPKITVSKLKTLINLNQPGGGMNSNFTTNDHCILKGNWKILKNIVSIVIQKNKFKQPLNGKRRNYQKEGIIEQENTFFIVNFLFYLKSNSIF
jgi:F-box protein 9